MERVNKRCRNLIYTTNFKEVEVPHPYPYSHPYFRPYLFPFPFLKRCQFCDKMQVMKRVEQLKTISLVLQQKMWSLEPSIETETGKPKSKATIGQRANLSTGEEASIREWIRTVHGYSKQFIFSILGFQFHFLLRGSGRL